jgi:TRAP-type C4-dicarboxylate transport system substrate-binding protein
MKGIALGIVGLVGMLASSSQGMSQTVLRFNLWVPPTHHTQTQMMMPWAADVEKATEGRVKVVFTPSSLGAPPRQFDLAAEGVADVTFGDHTYTPGRFFLTKMAELPFLGDSAESLSIAYWRTYSVLPQAAEEHKGTKLLSVFMHGPPGIMTTKKKIDSIAALSGLKIRVSGENTSKIMSLLGAVPVAVPATQVYELLSQGVVDGSVYNIDAYKNFHLERFMKFVTTVSDGLYNISFFLVMNKPKWDSLSLADQAAIERVSGEAFATRAGKVWDSEDKLSLELMGKNGVEITPMQGQFRDDVASRLVVLKDEWIKAAKERGVDGEKLLKEFSEQYAAVRKNSP